MADSTFSIDGIDTGADAVRCYRRHSDVRRARRVASGSRDTQPWSIDVSHLAWQELAACVGTDPETFFRPGSSPDPMARRLCDGCPVILTCREYALEHPELIGYWGGMSVAARQEARRLQRAAQ